MELEIELDSEPVGGGPLQINDALLTGLLKSGPTFNAYLKKTNEIHNQTKSKFTGQDIKLLLLPVGVACVVGFLATLIYKEKAFTAAENDGGFWATDFSKWVIYFGAAVVLNTFVNAYFLEDFLSEVQDNALALSQDISDIEERLKNFTVSESRAKWLLYHLGINQSPKKLAKYSRVALSLGVGVIILGGAFIAAYAFTTIGTDAAIIIMGLIATTILNYQGVKDLLTRLYDLALGPKRNTPEYLMAILKDAHKEALQSAQETILEHLQKGERHQVTHLYALLQRDGLLGINHPTHAQSAALLMQICQLAKNKSHQPSAVGRLTLQSVLMIMTLMAIIGWFLSTKSDVAQRAKFQEPNKDLKEYLTGTAVFFITAALAFVVSWDIAGSFYNLCSRVVKGIRTKTPWIIKPLSFQQNPKFMWPFFVGLYIYAYFSTKTTTLLNQEQLWQEAEHFGFTEWANFVTWWMFVPAVIVTWLFNAFPVDKIGSAFQRTGQFLFGPEDKRQEIQQDQLINKQVKLIDQIDDDKFLHMLYEITTNNSLTIPEREQILQILLGNNTAQQIFGESYQGTLREIIVPLAENNFELLADMGFFRASQPKKGCCFPKTSTKETPLRDFMEFTTAPL